MPHAMTVHADCQWRWYQRSQCTRYNNHGACSSASTIPYSAVLLGSNLDEPAERAPAGQHVEDEATSSAYHHVQPEPSISLEQHATLGPHVNTDGSSHFDSEEAEDSDEDPGGGEGGLQAI